MSETERLMRLEQRRRDFTPREREVVTQVVKGLTNVEVGAKLFITEKTVKFHLTQVYRKLGLRNRTELLRWHVKDVSKLDLDTIPDDPTLALPSMNHVVGR